MSLKVRNKGLRRVRVADIEDAPWNFREHPLQQREALAEAVDTIGWYGFPDVYETEQGKLRLTDGHLRKALLIEKYGPDAEIEVNVTDFSEEEAKKATLTKDPLAALAATNAGKLEALLREVNTAEGPLRTMLDDLLQQTRDWDGSGDVIEDDIPEPPDEPVTRLGDLWILGEHRLLCGDSARPDDVDRLLEGATIQLVNSDPPYGVKVESRSNNSIAAGTTSFAGVPKKRTHHQSLDLARHPGKSKPTTKKMRPKDRPLKNDFLPEAEFDALLLAWFGNMARVLEPGRSFYLWGGYANCANYPPALKECGLYFSQAIIWVKEHPVLTRKDFMGNHEWAFYGWKEGAGHKFFGPANVPDVWSVKKVNPQNMIHLTEKPVALAVRAIEYSSRPGENVLDLFGGSGSTLIAAQQTGRKAFLMELDPLYADVIVQRYEKFTGKRAELVRAESAS